MYGRKYEGNGEILRKGPLPLSKMSVMKRTQLRVIKWIAIAKKCYSGKLHIVPS